MCALTLLFYTCCDGDGVEGDWGGVGEGMLVSVDTQSVDMNQCPWISLLTKRSHY